MQSSCESLAKILHSRISRATRSGETPTHTEGDRNRTKAWCFDYSSPRCSGDKGSRMEVTRMSIVFLRETQNHKVHEHECHHNEDNTNHRIQNDCFCFRHKFLIPKIREHQNSRVDNNRKGNNPDETENEAHEPKDFHDEDRGIRCTGERCKLVVAKDCRNGTIENEQKKPQSCRGDCLVRFLDRLLAPKAHEYRNTLYDKETDSDDPHKSFAPTDDTENFFANNECSHRNIAGRTEALSRSNRPSAVERIHKSLRCKNEEESKGNTLHRTTRGGHRFLRLSNHEIERRNHNRDECQNSNEEPSLTHRIHEERSNVTRTHSSPQDNGTVYRGGWEVRGKPRHAADDVNYNIRECTHLRGYEFRESEKCDSHPNEGSKNMHRFRSWKVER